MRETQKFFENVSAIGSGVWYPSLQIKWEEAVGCFFPK